MIHEWLAFRICIASALSLSIGFATQASVPHSVVNAFKAILAVTATTEHSGGDVEAAIKAWGVQLEKALRDPLGAKIIAFEKAIQAHSGIELQNMDDLLEDLRFVKQWRDPLCHGSWRPPDGEGKSQLFFVNRKTEKFDSKVDAGLLEEIREATAKLAIEVMNVVTTMGYQFPGSNGPGKAILQ